MADDIDELLDEVESKFISPGGRIPEEHLAGSQVYGKKINSDGTEELDAAIHSICSIPEPIGPSASPRNLRLDSDGGRKCNVVFVGGSQTSSSSSSVSRRNTQRRPRQTPMSKLTAKRYFEKPVFELSVKDLEAESARRKQKERVETLFEKKLAVVTDKMILDVRKFKRIKSDVWSNFGDVRLLITEEQAKIYNIDYHIIHLGDEDMLLCKTFVACVKCSAVFSYESHAYGTSTLRSHLKSCGKPRYNMKEKKVQLLRQKRFLSEIVSANSNEADAAVFQDGKPPIQEKMLRFRDQANNLQEQILTLFVSKLKSFEMINNREFKTLLQTFVQIGSVLGNVDVKNFLCSQSDLSDVLLQQSFLTCEQGFKAETAYLYGLCFSVEIWMDVVEKVSYISLFCHYANDDGLFKTVILFTSEFPYEQKSSEDVTNIFEECLKFLDLQHCEKMIMVDYSFNMVTAFEKDYKFLQCICYSVSRAVQTVVNQLCVTEDEDGLALPGFASLINQCRLLVTHFKKHKLLCNLPKSLVFCASTCWKSTLEMLQSINDQWEHISDILMEREELDSFSFDQELLSLVVDFLDIFREGWNELSSLANPTLNMVIPWVNTWKNHCVKNEEESPFLASLKSYMSSAIELEVVSRITIYHKMATFLDPRFEDMKVLSDDDQDAAQRQAVLMIDQYKVSVTKDLNNDKSVHDSNNYLVDCFLKSNANNITSDEEVDNYMAEPFSMVKQDLDSENRFNPLKYWVRNKDQFPNLSRVALWLLACPASAIRTDESVLSANWMIAIKESEIPTKHLHTSMFIKSFKNL